MKVFLLFLAVAGACRVADDCHLCSSECYYLIFEGGGGICSPTMDYGGDFVGVIPRGSSIMCPNDLPTRSTSSTPAPFIMKPVTRFDNIVGGGSIHLYNATVREKKPSSSKKVDYNAIVREKNDEIIRKKSPTSKPVDFNAFVREKNDEIIRMKSPTSTPSSSTSLSTSASASSFSGWVVAGAIASVVFIFFTLLLLGFKIQKMLGMAYHRHHDELQPSDLV